MTMEAMLASVHLLAILTVVVFVSSEAALCRSEWMNAAVLQRLARVDMIYGLALLVLFLSGVARMLWGLKGMAWYTSQPLFHVKMLLFFAVALLALRPTLAIRRWLAAYRATGALPAAEAVRSTRRWIMVQAHLLPVIAVVAVFWARGM